MAPTPVVLVGGFLGAGKTSLLHSAAMRLAARGRRVGLVTNDQAPQLVDSTLLATTELPVREVAGSCFCCNFQAFLDAIESLVALDANGGVDAVLAEPVGSCVDLSATILQPLRARFHERFGTRPLSVLIDPDRLEASLVAGGELHADAVYIMRKQCEEADLLIVSKADQLDVERRDRLRGCLDEVTPGRTVRFVSSATGEGLDEWLALALETEARGGEHVVDVDYDRYANGEAVLGWLNASIALRRSASAPGWSAIAVGLLERIGLECAIAGAPIGHVKLWIETKSGGVAGNLTAHPAAPMIRAGRDDSGREAMLTLNARVQMSPAQVEAMVRRGLSALAERGVASTVAIMHVFAPGRPVPTYRYERVVD